MKLTDATFRIFDTETTGFDHDKDQVAEVAWLDVKLKFDVKNAEYVPEIVGSFSELCAIDRPMPFDAMAVNNITPELSENAPPFGPTKAKLLAGDVYYVAHNAAFDTGFFPEIKQDKVLCTNRMARHLIEDHGSYRLQYLRYSLGLYHNEVAEIQAHRAMGDVEVLANLFVDLINRSSIEDVDQLVRLCTTPIKQKIMYFGKKHYGQLWSEVPTSYLNWMKNNVEDLEMDTAYTLQVELASRA